MDNTYGKLVDYKTLISFSEEQVREYVASLTNKQIDELAGQCHDIQRKLEEQWFDDCERAGHDVPKSEEFAKLEIVHAESFKRFKESEKQRREFQIGSDDLDNNLKQAEKLYGKLHANKESFPGWFAPAACGAYWVPTWLFNAPLPSTIEEVLARAAQAVIGTGVACLAIKGIENIKMMIDRKMYNEIVAEMQSKFDEMNVKKLFEQDITGEAQDFYKRVIDEFAQVTKKNLNLKSKSNQINNKETDERTAGI